MNKLLRFILTSAIGLSVISCYDDSAIRETLNDHDGRLQKLEGLCKDMNEDIVVLQTLLQALQDSDYLTSFNKVVEGDKEVGYTLTFAKYGQITIRYGSDGADVACYVPDFDIRLDEDGVYYWTLDGEWFVDENGNKIPVIGAVGEKGDKGEQGDPGEPGTDGNDGPAGVDGVTPKLKIDEDYWYVSYDDGQNWTLIGKATGENGADGSDGLDPVFKNVYEQDGYVYVVLADGTTYEVPVKDTSVSLDILFDVEQGYAIVPGANYVINYTIVGGDEKNLVRLVKQDGNVDVFINPSTSDSGQIYVNADVWFDGQDDSDRNETINDDPSSLTEGDEYNSMLTIFLSVSDGRNNSVLKALSLTEGFISSVEDAYLADAGACTVTANVRTNTDYGIAIPQYVTWLSYQPETKAAMRTDEVVLHVQANDTDKYRSCRVSTVNHMGDVLSTFMVIQPSSLVGSEMVFADESVKMACVKAFDTDGDGILTYREAALVKDLKALKMPKSAKSFDELRHFISVTRIPPSLFAECHDLVSVTLPESLQTIGPGAFYNCRSLKSIVIPEGVIEIGCFYAGEESVAYGGVFQECVSLAEVTFLNEFCSWDSGFMFAGCTSLVSIELPELNMLPYYSFGGCVSLENVVLPSTMVMIEEAAFTECYSLKTIVLPESLQRISYKAFSSSGLSGSLVIPASVEYIDGYAFASCKYLESVVFVSETPCYCGEGVFDITTTIYVPEGYYDAYRSSWNNGNRYSWGDNPIRMPIIVDGDFSDWDALDPSMVSVANCAEFAKYTALKTVKVYADDMIINAYIELDESQLKDFSFLPLHIFINADYDMGQGTDLFLDETSVDYLLEGLIFADGQYVSFDSALYLYQGSKQWLEWNWTEIIPQGSSLTIGEGGNGKYELAIMVYAFDSFKLADTFSIGFNLCDSYWSTIGLLPNANVSDEDKKGLASFLEVKTNKF